MSGTGGSAGTTGTGGAGGGGACMIKPRMGCCFTDLDCGFRCYGGKCADSSEGVCKEQPPLGQCWADRDCRPGAVCMGAQICGCFMQCVLPDKPGNCIDTAVR
jgi:hypothetical protein